MKDLINKIHNTDCIPFMNSLSPEYVNLIIADPPFGPNFGKGHTTYKRNDKWVLPGYVEVDKKKYPEFSKNWISAAAKILKNDGSMYIFSGFNNLEFIMTAARESNLILRNQIIWKYAFGCRADHRWICSHYNILHCCKKPRKVKFYGHAVYPKGKESYADKIDVWENVWKIGREQWTHRIKTPTKLPQEVIKKILDYSSVPNDLVMDPFMGAGQTAWVAKEMSRNFIGCELSENFVKLANKRLSTDQYLLKEL